MKRDKIKILIGELMQIAPEFRKSFSHNQFNSNLRISHHQLYTLIIINKHEELSMSELAEKLGVSNQQITRIMDGLVTNELVERYVDPNNRRIVQTKMTLKGKEMIAEIEVSMNESMVNVLSVLSNEEIEESIVHIKALKKILEKTSIANSLK